MAGLTGKSIASAYKSLLRVDDDTNGINTGLEFVTDGEGTKTIMSLSDDQVLFQPKNDDTTTTFRVADKAGNHVMGVDTINNAVVAGAGGINVMTQYATFGIDNTGSAGWEVDTHYPIHFSNQSTASATSEVDFGTGTDPDDTFTTANTSSQYASQIVPMMWFVPDNISIDSVTSIEGADDATGDTTRMHLKSFTFNSGSTSCLTAGELLANSGDTTNAGNEQAYGKVWTINKASVTGGKVVLAFFRSDSVNSDYSSNITVKYHLV